MNDLQGWMDNVNRDAYPTDAIMTTWIGNHDIPRAIHFASGKSETVVKAAIQVKGGHTTHLNPGMRAAMNSWAFPSACS